MKTDIHHAQAMRYTMADWLALHALDRQRCLLVLEAVAHDARTLAEERPKLAPCYEPLDADATWALATAALSAFLPQHRAMIEDTSRGSEKIAIVGRRTARRAFTIDHGPPRYPTIFYNFHADASDPLVVAHEFGHALQIRASGGKFVAPVIREACAFIAECALLAHCQRHDPNRYDAVRKRWQADNRKYLGTLAEKLTTALVDDDAPYDYGWNYPVARYLALGIKQTFTHESVWSVFRGDYSIVDIMERLGTWTRA